MSDSWQYRELSDIKDKQYMRKGKSKVYAGDEGHRGLPSPYKQHALNG